MVSSMRMPERLHPSRMWPKECGGQYGFIRDCTPNLSRNQLGPSGLTVLVMVITWVGPNLGWASCTCIAVTGVASRSEVNAGLAVVED